MNTALMVALEELGLNGEPFTENNEAPNTAPVAVNDSLIITEGETKIINVLANDSDAETTPSVNSVTQGTHCTVSINGDDTLTVVADSGFSGSDSFTYTIIDQPGGLSDTATVNVTIEAGANLFLDLYPNQYGESWSLWKVKAEFTGDVIELRRTSDNTVERYGFDSSGELPYTEMASFVGGGDGRVSWFKGQANGLVVQQTNAVNQPWLYKSGVLQKEAGKPTLIFEGNQWLNGGNILNVLERPLVSLSVFNISNTGAIYAKAVAGNSANRYNLDTEIARFTTTSSSDILSFSLQNELQISNQIVVGDSHSVKKNNTQVDVADITGTINSTNFDFQIGAYNDSAGNAGGILLAIGSISEVHIYFEDKLSDLLEMNNLINGRYGIY